ncbi:sex-regulated protein janus-B [Drosophila pseudoobscura]|uniref:Sex-regulated protein janus-B n=1 Tax=Drosophila pseudoobscura pseudoobscura TaxID=46245 RepID=Q29JS2_DROPS|nr:sex-regulated protein janus-B [Drosophila pseudoobscura]
MDITRNLLLPTWRPLLRAIRGPRSYSDSAVASLLKFPSVTLEEGKSKYVLSHVYIHGMMGQARQVIRSCPRAKYHLNIYETLKKEANKLGLCTQGLGGGYIEYDPQKKYIKVYGKSGVLGKADHKKSQAILHKAYPDVKIDAERGSMKP